MQLLKNKFYICKVCGSINYRQDNYYESSSCHCTKCNKQQNAQVINNDLEDKIIIKDSYELTTGVVKNFSKFNLIIEKRNLEIDFNKAIEPLLVNAEELKEVQIAKILEEHMVTNKKNISLYEFKFDSSQEREIDKIQLYKDEKKLKAVKSKLKELLKYFSIINVLGEEICNGFQYGYSYNDSYIYDNLVELFRNPHIEILIKAGFTKLYYYDHKLNTLGTNPQEILQIPKSKCKFLKQLLDIRDKADQATEEEKTFLMFGNYDNYWSIFIDHPNLDLKMLANTLNKIRINCEELKYDRNKGGNLIFNYVYSFINTKPSVAQVIELQNKAKECNIKFDVLIDYLTTKVREEQGIASPTLAFKIYNEMLRYTEELHADLDKYPRNLITVHDKLAYLRVLNADEINKENFIKVVSSNKLFEYENDKYCMLTPNKIEDLGIEGDRLNNCIGTYVERYLTGQSRIYFMRNIEERDKALIAVEINKNDDLIQEHGYNNRSLTKEERELVKEWLDYIKNKRQQIMNEKLENNTLRSAV